MSIQNICIKFYASEGTTIDQDQLIGVFQRWIREQALEGVLIDIADYRHVPEGPGMMLIAHNLNYAMDEAEGGRLGVLAQRKRPQEGDHKSRILGVVEPTLKFIAALEASPELADSLKIDLTSFEYIANDRLRVANDDAALQSIEADLIAAGEQLYGNSVSISRRNNHPKARLAVSVSTGGVAGDCKTLLANIAQ